MDAAHVPAPGSATAPAPGSAAAPAPGSAAAPAPDVISVGASAALTFIVGPDDSAAHLGSGDLAVLGTPRLLAWFEAATCAAIALPAEATSVGTRIEVEHLAASALGSTVTVRAELVYVDGRLLRFSVVAHDAQQRLLGTGTITRVIVDRERFVSRLPQPS